MLSLIPKIFEDLVPVQMKYSIQFILSMLYASLGKIVDIALSTASAMQDTDIEKSIILYQHIIELTTVWEAYDKLSASSLSDSLLLSNLTYLGNLCEEI